MRMLSKKPKHFYNLNIATYYNQAPFELQPKPYTNSKLVVSFGTL